MAQVAMAGMAKAKGVAAAGVPVAAAGMAAACLGARAAKVGQETRVAAARVVDTLAEWAELAVEAAMAILLFRR